MKKLEEKTRGNCKIEWVDDGEGQHGKYDPNNKEDMPLLRFRCFAKVGKTWIPIKDGSVLSQTGTSEDQQMRETLLDKILDRVEPEVQKALDSETKAKDGELAIENGAEFFNKLSWFGPEMAEEY